MQPIHIASDKHYRSVKSQTARIPSSFYPPVEYGATIDCLIEVKMCSIEAAGDRLGSMVTK